MHDSTGATVDADDDSGAPVKKTMLGMKAASEGKRGKNKSTINL